MSAPRKSRFRVKQKIGDAVVEFEHTKKFSSSTPIEVLETVGRGSFGKVEKVKDLRDDKIYARKTILILPGQENYVVREVGILKGITSSESSRNHVVQYYGGYILSVGHEKFAVLFMEFFEGNTLLQLGKTLPDNTRILPSVIKKISLKVLQAIKFIHDRDVAHRDIKLENIMFNETCFKLIDFGLSCFVDTKIRGIRADKLDALLPLLCKKGIAGTPFYIAPEVWERSTDDFRPSDIWSFGVLIYTLVERKHPFSGKEFGQIGYKVINLDAPTLEDYDPVITILVNQCLNKNFIQRSKAYQLIDFLQDNEVSDSAVIKQNERNTEIRKINIDML